MGFDSWQEQDLPLLQNIQSSSGSHLAFCSVDIGDYFPRGKVTGAWGRPSPPSGVMVKNEESYTSAPPLFLNGMHKDSFTFLFGSYCSPY